MVFVVLIDKNNLLSVEIMRLLFFSVIVRFGVMTINVHTVSCVSAIHTKVRPWIRELNSGSGPCWKMTINRFELLVKVPVWRKGGDTGERLCIQNIKRRDFQGVDTDKIWSIPNAGAAITLVPSSSQLLKLVEQIESGANTNNPLRVSLSQIAE